MSKGKRDDDILKSIGTVLEAIDQKLEKILECQNDSRKDTLHEMQSFFEELSGVVSTRFIGDLPQSVQSLETRINIFRTDLNDFLQGFSNVLLRYENKLEKRIKDEIQALQDQFLKRLDYHQNEQIESLKRISSAIENLTKAITTLRNTVNEFNADRFDPALSKLEEILEYHGERKVRKGFFGKSKE